uniref:Ribosomal protein eL8/eL30/eS12/Gadd45 domain-containing protein n=1 Tax=Anopheles triannulatus TaxID=58253 RepID=A0A2M4AUU6_9DIPT
MVVNDELIMDLKFHTVGIGSSARKALLQALQEKRLVVGLANAVRSLAKEPDQFTFCFMAPAQEDSHMHEVLLEAFCLEHDIYIVRVDSAYKLSRLVQSSVIASCALVRKLPKKLVRKASNSFRRSESILVEHCELFLDDPHKPIVKLPEK